MLTVQSPYYTLHGLWPGSQCYVASRILPISYLFSSDSLRNDLEFRTMFQLDQFEFDIAKEIISVRLKSVISLGYVAKFSRINFF